MNDSAIPSGPDRLLRLSQVKEMTGLGRTMIYRLIKESKFPQQYKPGGFASRWSEAEITAWIRDQRQIVAPEA